MRVLHPTAAITAEEDGSTAAGKWTYQPCSSDVNRARMDLNESGWIGAAPMSDVPSGQQLTRRRNSSRADNQAATPAFVWSFWPQPDADFALFMAGALQLINAACFVAVMMCSDLGLVLCVFVVCVLV